MYRKTEVFTKIKKFITHYETEDRKCHRLKSDNAGEYLDKELAAWRAERGIKLETSTPNHQIQNGAAERLQ